MPALRTFGLVILAVFAVSIGILGYVYMRAVHDESAAREAALSVSEACQTVITVGGQQVVDITLPGDYHMRFLDNQIAVDNYLTPEQGLARRFAENAPELGPGNHTLSVTIDEDTHRLVVTRI